MATPQTNYRIVVWVLQHRFVRYSTCIVVQLPCRGSILRMESKSFIIQYGIINGMLTHVGALAGEVLNPQKTFPRAFFVLIPLVFTQVCLMNDVVVGFASTQLKY